MPTAAPRYTSLTFPPYRDAVSVHKDMGRIGIPPTGFSPEWHAEYVLPLDTHPFLSLHLAPQSVLLLVHPRVHATDAA